MEKVKRFKPVPFAHKNEKLFLNRDDDTIPEIRFVSRFADLPLRGRPSVATTPGTSGLGSQPAPPPAPPAPPPPPPASSAPARRHPSRQDRDRLFWTLMGNSSRMANRSRSSGSSQSRGARLTSFADLLAPDRRLQPVLSRCSSYSVFNSNGSPALSSFPSSLRNLAHKRAQDRMDSSPSRPSGASSSSGRQLILLRASRSSERANEAPVEPNISSNMPAHASDEEVEARPPSPRAVENPDDFVETVIEVEEPINMSTGAMSLEEEIVEIDPEPTTAAEPASKQNTSQEETPSVSPEATDQKARGIKRKKDFSGNTHESVVTLNQSLLRLLECPVCMEWMEPPIAQCRRGHLVCPACRKRLDTCPVCRTAFSSVRNRAMEDVAGILRYPCRHGCGREVRHNRRTRHEASCASRRYACPLPACEGLPPMPRASLPAHCQTRHPAHYKTGAVQRLSLRVNCEQRQHWVVSALGQLFHARADVAAHSWGVLLLVAFIGPQNHANKYCYEVSVSGRHNSRKQVYQRATHSDLEDPALTTNRQDCFHMTVEQLMNFLRFKNEHSDPDQTLDFTITIAETEEDSREISDTGSPRNS